MNNLCPVILHNSFIRIFVNYYPIENIIYFQFGSIFASRKKINKFLYRIKTYQTEKIYIYYGY